MQLKCSFLYQLYQLLYYPVTSKMKKPDSTNSQSKKIVFLPQLRAFMKEDMQTF